MGVTGSIARSVGRVVGAAPLPKLPGRQNVSSLHTRRDTTKDGFWNQLETFGTTHGERLWNLISSVRRLRRLANKILTNLAILKFPTRPNPVSTMADYTSWDSLTDRTFSGRHLRQTEAPHSGIPPVEDLKDLFTRVEIIGSPKSTVLFSYFAQWFTDGFLRSDRSTPPNPRKNESNHEIDLTNLYGLHPAIADQLRTGRDGLLKSQIIAGEEFPPYLCENGAIKPEFSLLTVVGFAELTTDQRDQLLPWAATPRIFRLASSPTTSSSSASTTALRGC